MRKDTTENKAGQFCSRKTNINHLPDMQVSTQKH